jgi:hypothetical protein
MDPAEERRVRRQPPLDERTCRRAIDRSRCKRPHRRRRPSIGRDVARHELHDGYTAIVRYEVNAGRVVTWSLEAHLVDHCNLRCVDCCTRSPFLPERAVDPSRLEADLARAAAVLRPSVFKLTGGEPTMHPELIRCLEIVRASKIAPVVQITTNGTLLAKQPTEFWELIDRVQVSLYPSAPLAPRVIAAIQTAAACAGVQLTLRKADKFQVMDPDAPLTDARAKEIWSGCWLRDRCHLIHDGRFYVCTRPPHLSAELAAEDGVDLHGEHDLLGAILRRLEHDEPLASCRHCLGGTGDWRPHAQLR